MMMSAPNDSSTTLSTNIWEQMLTEERRQLASHLGVRVSDLEEQQNLLLTLAQSRMDAVPLATGSLLPSASEIIESFPQHLSQVGPNSQLEAIPEQYVEEEQDNETEELQSFGLNHEGEKESLKYGYDYNIHIEAEKSKKGGPWYRLPQVLSDIILMYVGDPDMLGYIMMTSKVCFTPTERIFKFYCEQIYPRQTAKKICRIDKWITWQNMMIYRPRLRTNGIYTLRTMFSKGYCNDAFWEEKRYESVEVKYYRHFRFFNDGRVLYSLDVVEPYEMVKILERGEPIPKRVYAGRYTLVRNELHIDVQLHYCNMSFDLLLLDGDDGYQGKHNMLKLLQHSSSVTGGGRRTQLEHIPLPIPLFHDFRFFRFWHLHPDPPNVALFPDTL